jgi:hypothetical protein
MDAWLGPLTVHVLISHRSAASLWPSSSNLHVKETVAGACHTVTPACSRWR